MFDTEKFRFLETGFVPTGGPNTKTDPNGSAGKKLAVIDITSEGVLDWAVIVKLTLSRTCPDISCPQPGAFHGLPFIVPQQILTDGDVAFAFCEKLNAKVNMQNKTIELLVKSFIICFLSFLIIELLFE